MTVNNVKESIEKIVQSISDELGLKDVQVDIYSASEIRDTCSVVVGVPVEVFEYMIGNENSLNVAFSQIYNTPMVCSATDAQCTVDNKIEGLSYVKVSVQSFYSDVKPVISNVGNKKKVILSTLAVIGLTTSIIALVKKLRR